MMWVWSVYDLLNNEMTKKNRSMEKANQPGVQSEDPAWKKTQWGNHFIFVSKHKNLTMAGERQENEERAVGKGRSSGQV